MCKMMSSRCLVRAVLVALCFAVQAGVWPAGDAAAQPAVSRAYVDRPLDGSTWYRGDVIRARARFATPVMPSGPFHLKLAIGERTVEVDGLVYASGYQANFFYPVEGVDIADRIAMETILLNGNRIDLSDFPDASPPEYSVKGEEIGDPATLDLVGASNYFEPVNGTYRLGDTMVLFARFHKEIMVSGMPRLALLIGEETRYADYDDMITRRQDLAGAMYFTYDVQEGDCDMDGFGLPANALDLEMGSIDGTYGGPAVTDSVRHDPARNLSDNAVRFVDAGCMPVPAAPLPALAALGTALLAAGLLHVWLRRRQDGPGAGMPHAA